MIDICEESLKLQEQLVAWRRELHRCPEVGLETPLTAAFISKKLTDLQIEHQTNVGGSGIVGIIRGGKKGQTIALRADMDALAIREDTGLSFASQNGNMHACGHDAHAAMLLGAAGILCTRRDQLRGNIKLIFQSGEEGPGGAKPMIEEGVLEDPCVDSVMGLHIGNQFHEVKNGQVGLHYGNVMACLDSFKIKITGRGCHGAMPNMGVDPIVIAAQVITALQTLVSREIVPTSPAVVTVGIVNGGVAYNIIPDEVVLIGTARALEQGVRDQLAGRIENLVAGIAQGMRGGYEFSYTYGYPPLVNNEEFTKGFKKTAEKIVGAKNVIEIAKPTMGGEDMAYYLEKVPGTFFFLGSGNPEKNADYPHHNARFDIDEDVLWKGTALLAQGAIDWLENNGGPA